MTKIDYSQLSDREIDTLVLRKIYGPHVKDKDIMRAWGRGGFKYTTNWSDAGPIIVENQICLLSLNDKWRAHDFKYIAEHKNPLRAAMIVFLEMQ